LTFSRIPALGLALAALAPLSACTPGVAKLAPNAAPAAPVAEDAVVYPGVRHITLTRGDAQVFVAQVLDIDLTRPDLALVTTAADRSGGMEFVALRTSRFLAETGAIAAINASYFLPFAGGSKGGDDYYPHEGQPVNASGAVIAAGAVASPLETDLDIRVCAIVCFERLRIVITDGQACPAGYASGVAAGPRLLAAGAGRGFADFDNNYAATPQPRTAIGISADGWRGWMVVVDGRQEGYSAGANLQALTDLFVELGASDAINLDGGGSATLVVAGEGGEPRILNRPIHTGIPGRERPVANHIALVRRSPER
jgi:exopolysaccharide biosynthesis protein